MKETFLLLCLFFMGCASDEPKQQDEIQTEMRDSVPAIAQAPPKPQCFDQDGWHDDCDKVKKIIKKAKAKNKKKDLKKKKKSPPLSKDELDGI